MFLFGMTITASYYLPIYFQAVRDKSALVSGVDLLPGVLCQIVMALVSGALSMSSVPSVVIHANVVLP